MAKNTKEYMKKWREKNPNYEKERNQKLKRKEYKKGYNEEYREKNKVELKIKKVKYYQKNKEKIKVYKNEWRKNNPEKVRAHNMANKKLKYLKKPGFEMHHPDYNQPLLVKVLPIVEHRQLHIQLNL